MIVHVLDALRGIKGLTKRSIFESDFRRGMEQINCCPNSFDHTVVDYRPVTYIIPSHAVDIPLTSDQNFENSASDHDVSIEHSSPEHTHHIPLPAEQALANMAQSAASGPSGIDRPPDMPIVRRGERVCHTCLQHPEQALIIVSGPVSSDSYAVVQIVTEDHVHVNVDLAVMRGNRYALGQYSGAYKHSIYIDSLFTSLGSLYNQSEPIAINATASIFTHWLDIVYEHDSVHNISISAFDEINLLCEFLNSPKVAAGLCKSVLYRMRLPAFDTESSASRLDPWGLFKFAAKRDQVAIMKAAIAQFDHSINPGIKHLVLQGPRFWAGIPSAYALLLISSRYEDVFESMRTKMEEAGFQFYSEVKWDVVANKFGEGLSSESSGAKGHAECSGKDEGIET